ncbi:MAG: T9SS type A sorting domain-containing protein [Crocinitomicaceae bacterium]|nr:T9SS type A sorting domain-containing protein [Crocinitomicaceae bacterium]MCF8444403.1 T9SS type A sorting domain-containing protein [Crocinitomicaceae bacterium]
MVFNPIIDTENEMVIKMYDLAGNISSVHNLNSGKNIIPLRVKSGIYILSDEKGNRFRFYVGN